MLSCSRESWVTPMPPLHPAAALPPPYLMTKATNPATEAEKWLGAGAGGQGKSLQVPNPAT